MLIEKNIALDFNRNINLTILDARCIRVSTDVAIVEKEYKDGDIISLNFANQYYVKLGDIIEIEQKFEWDFNFTLIVNQIKKVDNYYLLYSHKRTKSSYFLFPILGYNRDYFKWNEYFINCYSDMVDSGYSSDKFLYITYKFLPTENYYQLEKNMTKLHSFVDLINIDDTCVFIHKIPDSFINDMIFFIEGKYSKLSNFLKKRILFFHNTNRDSEIGQILYKDENRKLKLEKDLGCTISDNMELYDIPGEEELLILNK